MNWPWNKQEQRAEEISFEDALVSAELGGGGATRTMALQIPTVSGGIDLIANIVAGTPIKLYRESDGKTKEVQGDGRLRLLNDETGDTLNANDFWRAMVRDYYLGKGGYAYIHKKKGQIASLHYVDERSVSIQINADPIFKDFDIMVNGLTYKPFDFLKILHNTRDGATGVPITVENSGLIEVAYETLKFEKSLVKRGGNKKGFLKAEKRIDEKALATLRTAFSRLYSNQSENMVVLNGGIDFRESSSTSTEMQLNENKSANAGEFGKLFHVSGDVMSGKASADDVASLARLAAIPLMQVIQCALNKDFLLEREKGECYWAFDTKELLKGDMGSRFTAYKTALDGNFMQIDEVRYAEDLPALGMTWVKLGLQDVLYDPVTKQIYTPNTNQTSTMGELSSTPVQEADAPDISADEVQEVAEETVGKTLNGAQTQSLITVVQQYQTGTLTLQQAVNIIAVAIGITKDEARELIGETTETRANDEHEADGKFGSKGLTNEGGSGSLQSSDEVNATGENPDMKGFGATNLKRHWAGGSSDHSEQYPDFTAEEYAQRAQSLVTSASDGKDILGFKTQSGAIVRYDVATNDFVKGYKSGGIATMFKPKNGVKYFESQSIKEGADTGG